MNTNVAQLQAQNYSIEDKKLELVCICAVLCITQCRCSNSDGLLLDCVALWHSGHVGCWTWRYSNWLVVAGSNPSRPTVECNTHVPLSPCSINWLVPASVQWCLAAGKVTVGLASHWPRTGHASQTLVVLRLRAQERPGRGRWASAYAILWSKVNFTFYFYLRAVKVHKLWGLWIMRLGMLILPSLLWHCWLGNRKSTCL